MRVSTCLLRSAPRLERFAIRIPSIAGLWRRWLAHRAAERTVTHLATLDAHLLDDIGITRSEIGRAAWHLPDLRHDWTAASRIEPPGRSLRRCA